MSRLILWRHGNTDWNNGERIQGQADVGLNDLGREQAAVAAPLLAALRPDVIISSDLRRARDTAEALAALTGLPVCTDPRLRERYFGWWQGMTLTEIAERYPADYAAWRSGAADLGCEIESLDDLGKRAGAALQEAVDSAPGATIVVATHGGAARLGCGQILGWGPEILRSLGSLKNCHWSELRYEASRGWQLRAHNVGSLTP
jgi:broad specificity phosphatase PhoE